MGVAAYFMENRHSTDMDTTGMGVYLPVGDVHLPRAYSHHISPCHKYKDDVTGRTQTNLFEERT